MTAAQKLSELIELANNYPSPHNGQPMLLQPGEEGNLTLLFDTTRGLTAAPISYLFSFVSIGVFVRHLELCAKALGHKLVFHAALPDQAAMASGKKLPCGKVFIDYDVAEPNATLQRVIESRQTSRKKYTAGLSAEEQRQAVGVVTEHGMKLTFLDPAQVQQTIWLNQRAVFDDMFNEPVRRELDHWLRYSAREKHDKRDGLAYDCMELSGGSLKFVVKHYRMLHWPIIASILQRYYLRTMKDSSSVGYITAPFETEQQAYEIGRCVIDMWIGLAQAGHYLHPFGTIVANDQAHADFVRLVGLQDEARGTKYIVFIFRAGASATPVESDRIPVNEHLYVAKEIS